MKIAYIAPSFVALLWQSRRGKLMVRFTAYNL